MKAVDNPQSLKSYIQNKENPKAVFTFHGHRTEGYSLDWSPVTEGLFKSLLLLQLCLI